MPHRLTLPLAAAALLALPGTALAASPKVTIVSNPPAASTKTTAHFAWRASGTKLRVSCVLDGRTPTKCSGSVDYSRLRDGRHTFTVTATSGSRHASASYRWLVDTKAPSRPRVSGDPGDIWAGAPVTLSARSSDAGVGIAGYEHRSARGFAAVFGVFRRAVAGSTMHIATEDVWSVEFRAIDRLGHRSAWSAPVLFGLDLTAPTVDAGALFDGSWKSSISDAASDNLSFELSVLWRPYMADEPVPGPWHGLDELSDGVQSVCVTADDIAGHRADPACGELRFDATAPTVEITGGGCTLQWGDMLSAASSTDATSGVAGYHWHVEFSYSTDEGVTYRSLPEATIDVDTADVTVDLPDGLPAGTTNVSVYELATVTDAAGNSDSRSVYDALDCGADPQPSPAGGAAVATS
jgi:hypothetical protein